MKVIEKKKVKEVKVAVNITVPAWIKNDLGFKPGDEAEWFLLETDDGETVGCLRRIPTKTKGEEEEKKPE